jgi:hypothetical protein
MGKKGNAKPKKFTLDLPVHLTERELLERGDALVKQFDDLDKIEAALSEAKAEAKAAREPVEESIRQLKIQIRTKKEPRPVECKLEPDFANGVMETIRLDTGEIVTARPLAPEERQESLLPPEPCMPEGG